MAYRAVLDGLAPRDSLGFFPGFLAADRACIVFERSFIRLHRWFVVCNGRTKAGAERSGDLQLKQPLD